MMHRIDTEDATERWRWVCPHRQCESTNWRATNGQFECRACGRRLSGLRNQKTDEVVPREEIEFVGSSWKAPYSADPTAVLDRQEGD